MEEDDQLASSHSPPLTAVQAESQAILRCFFPFYVGELSCSDLLTNSCKIGFNLDLQYIELLATSVGFTISVLSLPCLLVDSLWAKLNIYKVQVYSLYSDILN